MSVCTKVQRSVVIFFSVNVVIGSLKADAPLSKAVDATIVRSFLPGIISLQANFHFMGLLQMICLLFYKNFFFPIQQNHMLIMES